MHTRTHLRQTERLQLFQWIKWFLYPSGQLAWHSMHSHGSTSLTSEDGWPCSSCSLGSGRNGLNLSCSCPSPAAAWALRGQNPARALLMVQHHRDKQAAARVCAWPCLVCWYRPPVLNNSHEDDPGFAPDCGLRHLPGSTL